ncbi:MAG: hypothetical protein ACRDBY_00780 [Cetobacterium sp.]
MVDVYKTREQMIRNEITRVTMNESKVKFVTIIDDDTGEILDERIPVNKKKLGEKIIKGNCAEPYARCTLNKEVINRYLDPLGNADFRRVHQLISSLDAFGRLKYGSNLQQYCRTFEDIGLIVGLNGKPLAKFIKIMRELQIIRVVIVDKASLGKDYNISVNPAIAVNGVFFDRATTFVWLDVIKEFELLSDKDINHILNCKKIGIIQP